jgi:hypothetical protein
LRRCGRERTGGLNGAAPCSACSITERTAATDTCESLAFEHAVSNGCAAVTLRILRALCCVVLHTTCLIIVCGDSTWHCAERTAAA